MAEMHVIVKLSDASGTSITMNNTSLQEVVDEFHSAWVEQRLMNVGMEAPGYAHKVNPQQVTLIHELSY